MGVVVVFTLQFDYPAGLVIAYATVLGTCIDVDHILIARINDGDWHLVSEILTSIKQRPTDAVRNPSTILDGTMADYVRHEQRLLSHVLVGGLIVILSWSINPFLGALSGLLLSVHVTMDLLADTFDVFPGESRR